MKNYLSKDMIMYLINEIGLDETTIDVSQPNGEVEITNTMGYVSSVEDARKILEEIFKIKPESKES